MIFQKRGLNASGKATAAEIKKSEKKQVKKVYLKISRILYIVRSYDNGKLHFGFWC